jgi:hypothetical protein
MAGELLSDPKSRKLATVIWPETTVKLLGNGLPTYWPMPKVGVAELVSTVRLVAAVSVALRIMVPVTVPPPLVEFVKEKWKVSALTGHAAIETKNADKIGSTNRSSALISGLLRTLNRITRR